MPSVSGQLLQVVRIELPAINCRQQVAQRDAQERAAPKTSGAGVELMLPLVDISWNNERRNCEQ